MKKLVFAFPGNEKLSAGIINKTGFIEGKFVYRHFPDGESYLQLLSDVEGAEIIIICTLHDPDTKILPLLFFVSELKERKAGSITLIAPYIAYMRQDKEFKPGEIVSSRYFAKILSGYFDRIITIDPHLHRIHNMAEIYSVPCTVIHASNLISEWIKENSKNAVLIGPDEESKQWVSQVAKNANTPYVVLQKTRYGDREVKVTLPQVELYKEYTPILVDDIISTAHTMIETVKRLKNAGMKPPVCIGVHAVFAGNAYHDLLKAGVVKIVTCNTILHPSNKIDISGLLIDGLKEKKVLKVH